MRVIMIALVLVIGLAPVSSAGAEDGGAAARQWRVADLLAMAERGRTDELAAAIAGLTSAEPARDSEAVLYRFALEARTLSPAAMPTMVLERLAAYESRVLVAHPESRGALRVPLYDISRIAAGTLRFAQHERQVGRVLSDLERAPGEFWRTLGSGKSAVDARVLGDVVERTSLDSLAAGRDSLAAAWKAGRELDPALAAMALRLGDRELAERTVRRADASAARRVVSAAADRFDDAEALALLRIAAGRQPLASGALNQAGRLLPRSAAARDWLYGLLDDPLLGTSAAAALADHGGEAAVRHAGDTLDPGLGRGGINSRVLLLHLAGTPAARERLAAFVRDSAMPEALRQEVARWQ